MPASAWHSCRDAALFPNYFWHTCYYYNNGTTFAAHELNHYYNKLTAQVIAYESTYRNQARQDEQCMPQSRRIRYTERAPTCQPISRLVSRLQNTEPLLKSLCKVKYQLLWNFSSRIVRWSGGTAAPICTAQRGKASTLAKLTSNDQRSVNNHLNGTEFKSTAGHSATD